MKLISDQVTRQEIDILLRELNQVDKSLVNGDVVELGCYLGTASLFISRHLRQSAVNRAFHVYDSFEGLPEKLAQDRSPAGEQFIKGELLATKSQFIKNYKQAGLELPFIHKGWFEDLQPTDLPSRIALAFLDGDYYSSIRSSLKLVWPKMAKGAVVIVDDYASESLPGAKKAVDEWLRGHPAKIRVEAGMALIHI